MNSLIDACEDMILRGPERSYLQFILSSETGVGYMLIQDKFDDLRNMHTVLSNISEQQPMADAMRDHIIACGEKIILVRTKEIEQVFSKKKSDEYKVSNHYIDHLLDLHRKYFALIRDEFNNDGKYNIQHVKRQNNFLLDSFSLIIVLSLEPQLFQINLNSVLLTALKLIPLFY